MKKILVLLVILISNHLVAQTYKFINGKWFNGKEFISMPWFVVNGSLTSREPQQVDSIINLNGGFVVPPFGEAHNHNVRKFSGFRELANSYLRDGIYYVKNPNCLSNTKKDLLLEKLINNKHGIDAVFGNGGLTGENGHPIEIVKIMEMRGEWTKSEGDGNFYYSINSLEELKRKWPDILKTNPDFIKSFLFFSEEFDARSKNPKYNGFKGLNPDLLTYVVSLAHAVGLRISAHVETSHDFHVALLAKVDEINHMPGFRGDAMLGVKTPAETYVRFLVSDHDARIAAKQGTIVVTTLSDINEVPFFISMRQQMENINKQNLRVLKNAGVKIALGSDSFDHNSLNEVDYLKEKGVFTNLELLKMLCEITPLTIFPERKIAQLNEGYEASFLVLKNDPIRHINAIKNIMMYVKQGAILNRQLKK